ncbi:MAG: general secretion pathway protein GspF [Gammaproteobacteria bacterium]|nr:general secretion pathway protein GspF [Gammaproteobacteria bacterium]MDH3409480.1 general secretion pathway protein GspF [Gammaproteobacteria bacterium]MDH3552591.1 general secretion pathway protein GspF [Gammaproteobacteria bacterium]
MAKKRNARHWDEPQYHADHPRPVTRRQFVAQGFMTGAAYTTGAGILSLFSNPREAMAALSGDLSPLLLNPCQIATNGAGKIPFICFDLAGGANIAGSNVLVGKEGGQLDFLSTAGYEKMGLPGDMIPGLVDPTLQLPYENFDLGLGFHLDSAFRRGIMNSLTPGNEQFINGAVIPARSDNDTGNNPHNPMNGIARAGTGGLGADGSILTLTGTENTASGGNSTLPQALMDPSLTPTKVDRPGDVVNLVDTGDLVGILSKDDATAVMESIYRITDRKMDQVNTQVTQEAVIKELVRCGYLKSADIADRFGGVPIDPSQDPMIVGPTGIFTDAEFNGGGRDGQEFRKTAAIMKLVINGYAGAGTIEMGGYDYHGGARAEGEVKDERAGRCMGACLEYAARQGVPLMMYVFSDGSLSSNGTIDNSLAGRGKGEWSSDNSSTAGAFFLVYNPGRRPTIIGATPEEQAVHQQIGYMDAGGSVQRAATPAANNVNLLVNTVLLNYMALHGEQGQFANVFPNHGLGNSSMQDSLTAFTPICNGTIGNPV